MLYRIKLKERVRKELVKIPKKDYYKIISALTILSSDPWLGKKMQGVFNNSYSYRVWPYRIIYQIFKQQLLVFVICLGHRKDV